MKPVPDGDTHADRHAAADRRPRWRSPPSARSCSACCPASSCASATSATSPAPSAADASAAGRAADDDPRPRSPPPAGRSRSTVHGARAVRRRTASTPVRRRARPAGGATSSPRRRSGRCSAPSLARCLDAEWERLGRPDPFTVVDAGAGPGTLARSVLAAAPACRDALRYVAVEVSDGAAGPPPRRRRVAAPTCRPGRSTASSSPTSCSTTCRSASPCSTAAGGRRSSPTTATARSSRCCRRRSTRCRPCCRRPPPHGARAPLQRRGRGAGSAARVGLVRRGTVVVVDYAVARHRRAGRCARGGSGCARTAATSAATHYLRRPGRRRTSPPTSPLDQLPEPDAVRTQAAVPRGAGASTSSSTRAGAAWAAAAARAGPRGDDACAAGSREAEALLDPTGLGRLRRRSSGRAPRPDGAGMPAPAAGGQVEQFGGSRSDSRAVSARTPSAPGTPAPRRARRRGVIVAHPGGSCRRWLALDRSSLRRRWMRRRRRPRPSSSDRDERSRRRRCPRRRRPSPPPTTAAAPSTPPRRRPAPSRPTTAGPDVAVERRAPASTPPTAAGRPDDRPSFVPEPRRLRRAR